MSKVTTRVNTNNQLVTDYDYSKIFIFGNNYENGLSFTNTTGADIELEAGTLMGRVAAANELVVMKSAAADGSQYPVGVLAANVIIPDTEQIELPICIAGQVAEEKLIFDGTDNMDTVVDLKTYRDRIKSDTMGIEPVLGTENTSFGN